MDVSLTCPFQPIHQRANRIQKIATEALEVPHSGGSDTELIHFALRGLLTRTQRLDISITINTYTVYILADITQDVFYHTALLFF